MFEKADQANIFALIVKPVEIITKKEEKVVLMSITVTT